MSRSPLTLELSDGFVVANFEPVEHELLLEWAHPGTPTIEVVAGSPALTTRRVLGEVPGTILPAGTVVGSRSLRKVYAAGRDGIWEFSLDAGERSLLVGHPDLPSASKAEAQAVYGVSSHTENWVSETRGRPSYHWAFELDVEHNRLFALCGQEGALHHLVEIDLESRSINSLVPMRGFTAGIELDVKRRRILLPATKTGPQILDFSGEVLARSTSGQAFCSSAVHPSADFVVLADQQRTLWRWDWEHDRLTRLTEKAAVPRCSPDGAIFFMRTSSELWVLEHEAPKLIVRAGLAASEGWETPPRISSDGRFVLAQLTALHDPPLHDAVVVDLVTRRVQQLTHFYEHNVKWLGP